MVGAVEHLAIGACGIPVFGNLLVHANFVSLDSGDPLGELSSVQGGVYGTAIIAESSVSLELDIVGTFVLGVPSLSEKCLIKHH